MTEGRTATGSGRFIWGSATSSYQVEGATNVDGRGESIWDRFAATPGRIADGSDGSVACDHYHRYDEDIALMNWMGLDAYRFSIAWPRVVPDGDGAVNPAGLDFYDRLVDALLAAGISPCPTLYHWDLPQALEDKGGWTARATAEAFVRYTEAVVGRLGDRIDTWMTLNEPFVSADHGYRAGEHAPGRTSLPDALAAAHHLLLAHGMAVPAIRRLAPTADVGIVLNFTPVVPDPEPGTGAAIVDAWENRWYVEPVAGSGYPEVGVTGLDWAQDEVQPGDLETIAAPIDVLGVNYYTCQRVAPDGTVADPEPPLTDFGWEIAPDHLRQLLERLHQRHGFARYLITENGAAMPDKAGEDGEIADHDRIEYYRDHIEAVMAARTAGVPVEGYYAWSLLDNFEWAQGYRKTFGLLSVEPGTLERRPKASAHWLRERIRTEKGERDG
ncbi:MAG: GH1 family beta-glucosidase [Actinomycetota bacterium]